MSQGKGCLFFPFDDYLEFKLLFQREVDKSSVHCVPFPFLSLTSAFSRKTKTVFELNSAAVQVRDAQSFMA